MLFFHADQHYPPYPRSVSGEVDGKVESKFTIFLYSQTLSYPVMEKWQDHIESTPDVLKGKPRIKDTRIPVSLILGYLASGYSNEEIIKEFPDLSKSDIAACLSYARDLSEFEATV